jgi:hypothetical protein
MWWLQSLHLKLKVHCNVGLSPCESYHYIVTVQVLSLYYHCDVRSLYCHYASPSTLLSLRESWPWKGHLDDVWWKLARMASHDPEKGSWILDDVRWKLVWTASRSCVMWGKLIMFPCTGCWAAESWRSLADLYEVTACWIWPLLVGSSCS